MSKIYDIILSYFALRRITQSDRLVRECDKIHKRNLNTLEKKRKALKYLEMKLTTLSESISEDLDETSEMLKKSKEALEAISSEKKIADEIIIPGLVQSNKLLLERTSADTTEQVRRQVANALPSSGEE